MIWKHISELENRTHLEDDSVSRMLWLALPKFYFVESELGIALKKETLNFRKFYTPFAAHF